MTFCGKCGAQLQGDERFCVACGADVSAQTASTAAVTSAPATAPAPGTPVPPRPVAPIQPTGFNGPYAAPGQIPVVVGMPPPAQPKRGWMWVAVIVVVLGGLYYIGKHNPPAPTQQQPAPGQQPAPAQPGVPSQQPGVPSQPGVPEQPAVYPEQQPGVPGQPGGAGQSGDNAALVKMQMFGARWDPVNGNIQISQARWTNNANVIIQSATLECVQFAANGAVLTQRQTTLNGPVQPRGTFYFGPFQMGSIVQNLAKVNCGIVGVTPVSQ